MRHFETVRYIYPIQPEFHRYILFKRKRKPLNLSNEPLRTFASQIFIANGLYRLFGRSESYSRLS